MIDLGVGSADLLKEILEKYIQDSFLESDILSGMPYNKNGPLSFVVETIYKIHEKFHPGLIKPTTKIVIGSGASQLISCFFHINKKVKITSPYWFRIPVMSSMKNSELLLIEQLNNDSNHLDNDSNRLNNDFYTKLITYPNNPDGKLQTGERSSDWYDAVYLWPWYMEKDTYENALKQITTAPKKAMIFSLSKMTGHCGVRFGWALVDDEDLYNEICDYMEYESGGLGFDTQLKTEEIMSNVLDNKNWEKALKQIEETLKYRKKQLLEMCKLHKWQYDAAPGMFAWVSTDDNSIFYKLNELNIKSTPGSKCGGFPNQIRLNLAVSTNTWKGFVKVLENRG